MKPPPLAATTLGSRIGSPATTGVRTMAPTKSLMASGRSGFLMKLELAAAAGQVCQPTSLGRRQLGRYRDRSWRPAPRRSRAAAAAAAALGASGARLPLASIGGNAAGERERHRGRRDARVSLRFTFHNDANGGSAVSLAISQLNVKAWLMRRIQIALITRYAVAFCGPTHAGVAPSHRVSPPIVNELSPPSIRCADRRQRRRRERDAVGNAAVAAMQPLGPFAADEQSAAAAWAETG